MDNIAKGIRNAFVVAGTITFIYIIFHFFSGNYMGDRLEGTWRAVCTQDTIIFKGDTFIRGQTSGEFWVRANLIYFCTNYSGYPIRVTTRYMLLNGVLYFQIEPVQHNKKSGLTQCYQGLGNQIMNNYQISH
jgi:hypothetical protein